MNIAPHSPCPGSGLLEECYSPCPIPRRARCAKVSTFEVHSSDVLSTTLVLFLVEAKVFSGSSEKQQGEARGTLSAPPVEQKLVKEVLPDGYSSPSNSCQSSNFSEPSERQQQSVLKSGIPLSGFLCPLQDLCTSPQEDSDVQIEREIPTGKERGR